MNRPGFGEALRVWCRVALLSFGGPAGQIAVMHRILVEEKRWIGEPRFLHALNFCMLLPGPEAQQLATYLGWLLNGWRGGLVAGTLFVLPGIITILALSILYANHQGTMLVTALFFGLKPAVIAVIVAALVHLARRTLRGTAKSFLALGAFVAMFVFHAPFAAVVAVAAGIGLVAGRRWPTVSAHRGSEVSVEPAIADELLHIPQPSPVRTLAVAAGGLTLWWLPILLLALWLSPDHVLVRAGVFFGKVAVISFGGAYAVLAYVAQEAVQNFHWLNPAEMLDGLGMAETTPGPLIMVVQFVGFMAAFRHPGGLDALGAAVLGSLLVTWMTFVPCFLWIFLGGPYVERMRAIPALAAALSAITAAVVGVILNLVVWFAIHVCFGEVTEARWGPARVLVPVASSVSVMSVLIAAGACVAMLRYRWGMFPTLLAGVGAGALFQVVQLGRSG
jgi:chromate transporter